jgi:hypothetical protein
MCRLVEESLLMLKEDAARFVTGAGTAFAS